jgi:hypothetical protein
MCNLSFLFFLVIDRDERKIKLANLFYVGYGMITSYYIGPTLLIFLLLTSFSFIHFDKQL